VNNSGLTPQNYPNFRSGKYNFIPNYCQAGTKRRFFTLSILYQHNVDKMLKTKSAGFFGDFIVLGDVGKEFGL
jgi:hypothetical protein